MISMLSSIGKQPADMEKPDSSWNFTSSSFMRTRSSLYFSWISWIMGWYADIFAVLFCCFTCSGNISSFITSVNRMMVMP